MVSTVRRDGSIAGLTLTDRISVDEVVGAIHELEAIDPDRDTVGMVVDLAGLDDWHVDVEDLHRIGATIRSHFARGPRYRVAVVSREEGIETLVRNYVEVRDLLTAPRAELPPELRVFTAHDAARAWVAAAAVD